MDIIEEKYGNNTPKIECLDYGFVELIDCMPRMLTEGEKTADYAIAEAARCSYKREKKVNDDKTLIRYLMRHTHTSPLEMIEFKFHMKLPIFVARQIVRTRTANLNEMSGRYSKIPEEYYLPEKNNIRKQSEINKQGSIKYSDGEIQETVIQEIKNTCGDCFTSYKAQLEVGITREQARIVLPLNSYTEWYWKIDLNNLLKFLALRCDEHTQQETRIYAEAILELITPIVPITIEAWNNYNPLRGAIILNRLEIEKIKEAANAQFWDVGPIDSSNKRERKEWVKKAKELGIDALDIDNHD